MDDIRMWIDEYRNRQQTVLTSVPTHEVALLLDIVRRAWRAGHLIVAMGNGGSAANASHFAVDLGKTASCALGKPVRVMALTDSVPWITAVANDHSFDEVFVRQLQSVAGHGDLIIALSVSGNSANVIKAVEWGNNNGIQTVALVGGGGGKLAQLAHRVIRVADTHFGRVEDTHMSLLHMICYAFVECERLRSSD